MVLVPIACVFLDTAVQHCGADTVTRISRDGDSERAEL